MKKLKELAERHAKLSKELSRLEEMQARLKADLDRMNRKTDPDDAVGMGRISDVHLKLSVIPSRIASLAEEREEVSQLLANENCAQMANLSAFAKSPLPKIMAALRSALEPFGPDPAWVKNGMDDLVRHLEAPRHFEELSCFSSSNVPPAQTAAQLIRQWGEVEQSLAKLDPRLLA